MKFTETELAGGVEILAADDFTGIPICLTGTAEVKAGTPIDSSGAPVDMEAENAVAPAGILLYDVNPKVNPNGTIVVIGVIDQTKAEAHSGMTLDADALKAAVPGLVLRNNTGVQA